MINCSYFKVTVPVGVGPLRRNYVLDPDTGSDLTWMPCHLPGHPAPRVPSREKIYQPRLNQVVRSNEAICASLGDLRRPQCEHPEECCYEVKYKDGSSSRGVLVRETLTFGGLVGEQLVIGCGYNQQPGSFGDLTLQSLLSLSRGQLGIPSQLHRLYGIGNATAHCLNARPNDRNFVFLGRHRELFSLRCLTWIDILPRSEYYSLKNAQLYYGENRLQPNSLFVVFDAGCTYNMLTSFAFRNVLQEIDRGLQGEFDRVPDLRDHVCWKLRGQQRVPDIVAYAKNHLRPLSFRVPGGNYAIPPESYLIKSSQGNLCLGLLDGGKEDFNVIGDISLQGKLLIFDNELHKIGWASVTCDRSRTIPAVCA